MGLSDCPLVYALVFRPQAFPSRTGSDPPCRLRALPAPAHGAYTHAEGLRLREPAHASHSAAYRVVFPVLGPGQHTKVMISELNTSPSYPRANASPPPYTGSRRMTRGRGGSLRPTTWWTFTTSSMPVYAGAFPSFFQGDVLLHDLGDDLVLA